MKRILDLAGTAILKLTPNFISLRSAEEPMTSPGLLLHGAWIKRFQEELDGELITFIEEIVFDNARTGTLSVNYPARPELKPDPFRFTYVTNNNQLTMTFTSALETEPMIGQVNYTINGRQLTIRYGNNSTQVYHKKRQFLD